MSHAILIHSAHHETRVAIVEQGTVQELHIERHQQQGIVGNVYLGKISRVLPGMQSAFVDIGLERAAFLHVADLWQHKKHEAHKETNALTPIEKLLFPGQTVLVQVVKDSLGSKGARLTTQISLAGRYLVLLPQDQHIGLSQKISHEAQRKALRAKLNEALPAGFDFGLIARTQAQDASSTQLASDIEYLTQVWRTVLSNSTLNAAPFMLHRDATIGERTLRDLCNEHTAHITVDGAAYYQNLCAFAQQYMPALLPKLREHQGEHPLFELANIDQEVNLALQRRVNLPSGGYVVFDQTESMCTIDVNTGAFVGTKHFAQTILKTNLEAANAIARQLRLRNLGGIILIDFIDMVDDDERQKVRAQLAQALDSDPVRTHIHGFTALGLMELTRKRVRESLAHVLLQNCQCCDRTGQVKTAQTVAYDVLREIELQARQFDCKGFDVKVSQHVFDWFNAEGNSMIQSLEVSLETSIHLVTHTLTVGADYSVIAF
jgi:ribonuclease G